jgi:hypothetical protein
MTTVNTKTCRRRLVSYASLDDVGRDLDRIEAAHRAGTLKRLGNHEAGPVCQHLAMAMQRSFDGFPIRANPLLRMLGRAMKKRELARQFRPGFKLGAAAEQFAWSDATTFDEGMGNLRTQLARARAAGAAPAGAHPFFGPMTPAEWQVYYLRHAELHLSFLQPEPR